MVANKIRGIGLILLSALGLAAAPAPPFPPTLHLSLSPLSGAELSRVAAGEVVVRLERSPGGGPRQAVGVGTIDRPPARVFAALTDFAHWSEFMPFLRRSDARRQSDGSVLLSESLDLPSGERHDRARAVSRVEGAGERAVWQVSWSHVPGSGNIAAQTGSWTLASYGAGRTLAVLRLASDPGGVPGWLADRGTARSVPWIFNGLRQQVERGRYAGAG